ncbi:MAG: hypothetical protein Q4G26_13825 [Paracoccus sp. (in: a-proteobacteria)]|nr:hypothetical protein [Paracoccus sp. (in: a-proteobacteria)]
MTDFPDTFAANAAWKALPVPDEEVTVQCQLHSIRFTVKADPAMTLGQILPPGRIIRLRAGQQAYIRPNTTPGGIAVMEAVS